MVKILLSVVVVLALLAFGLYQTLVLWDTRGVLNHVQAEAQFFEDAATADCVTEPSLRAAAEARGWPVSDTPQHFYDEPESWDSALFIRISPLMPFAKLPGRGFYFDAAGCLIN